MTGLASVTRNSADRTAARLGRIVIIGVALLEGVVMAIAFFSNHGHAAR